LGDDWSDKEMIKAFILGCKGFITKSSSHVLLREIIGSTIRYKGNYLLHQISERFKASELLNLTIKDFNQIREEEFDDCPLNSREISILEQISKGSSSKSIAEILNLGEQTIKNYVSGILIKTGAKNRTHAVYISIKNNWISTLN
jgi:DNA-binding NarL/FixJ family response regulator